MRAVLADAAQIAHNRFTLLGGAVAVPVGQLEEIGFAVVGMRAVGIEHGAVEPDALAILHFFTDRLLRLVEAVAVVVEQPRRIAALFRDDEPTLGVESELNQRADLVVAGDLLHDEPRRNLERTFDDGVPLRAAGREKQYGNNRNEAKHGFADCSVLPVVCSPMKVCRIDYCRD